MICPYCKKKEAEPNRARCNSCLTRSRSHTTAYRKRIAEGYKPSAFCTNCHTELREGRRIRCHRCHLNYRNQLLRAWINRNKSHTKLLKKDINLKKNYNFTLHEYNELLKKQNGVCAICLQPSTRFHLDHNHTTGQVRAVLCNNCNVGLGYFKENITYLQAAITFVQERN